MKYTSKLVTGLVLFALTATTQFARGAGVTVITHGWNSETDTWISEMANAIATRAGSIAAVSQYTLVITNDSGNIRILYFRRDSGSPPVESLSNREIIVKVCWADVDGGICPWITYTTTIAQLVTTALTSPNAATDGSLAQPLAQLPLHLIGHSRGGSVMARVSRNLGVSGLFVDHLTTIDPHPLACGDAPAIVYDNVIFADNYWRADGLNYDFDGQHIEDAYEGDMNGIVTPTPFIGGAHSKIHAYYHGTVDLNETTVDGITIQPHWYDTSLSPVRPARNQTGFYFSRIAQGNRFNNTAGLNWFVGGASIRLSLTRSGSQWADVILANTDDVWSVQQGKELRIRFQHRDSDSSHTIELRTDDDRNPYNTPPNNSLVATLPEPASGSGVISVDDDYSWHPGLSDNGRYFYAKVTDTQSHTRYFYLPKPFAVSPTPPPPEPPPPTQGSDLARSAALIWDDRDGDQDGVPEAGEKVRVKIRLRNTSTSMLRDVRGTLSTTFGNVQISDTLTLYYDLDPGQASYGVGDYDMAFDFASTSVVPFHLRATYSKDGLKYYQDWDFSTTIYQNGVLEPQFVVDHVVWDDSPPNGDGDGVIESGENPDFWIWLKNTGSATATEVRATVTDVAVLKVREETLDYPNLVAGGGAQGPTSDFDLDDRIPASFSGQLTADIVVTYSGSDLQKVILDYPLFDVKPAPWIRVSPERYDFGVSPTTTNVTFSWTIRNAGTTNMNVTAITSTDADTTWSGDALPWSIAAGDSKTITVSITTSNLQGPISRSLVISTDARIHHPGEDESIIITGVVGDTVPLSQVPNVTGADHPDISGNWIVWRDSSSGNADIYAYNLATGAKRQITTNTNNQYSPYISGNLIVWNDKRDDPTNSYYDVYAYDLSRPELGEFRVAPALSPGRSQVLGVEGNSVALFHVYEWLYDNTSPDTANNLYVYDYMGNGQFAIRYTTAFAPGSGTQTRLSVNGPDHNSDGDFGERILTFQQGEVFWYVATGTWQTRNWTTRVINFAIDSSNRQAANGTGPGRHSAAANRFVFVQSDGNGDDQIWIWREPGTVQQLTFTPDLGYADDVLGLGGPDGGDCLVYDYGDRSRPGLYYLDRSNNQQYLISSSVDPEDLRMDGLRVVFLDNAASSAIKYIFLKQPDIAISSANITFDNDSPLEGSTISVGVTVQNVSGIGTTSNLTVRLYDGDPDSGGVQLGTDRVISGGIAARSSAAVTFNIIPVGDAGIHNIFARASALDGENPANNKASRTLTVVGFPQTVRLEIMDGFAFETGPKPALILVQRSGSTNAALGVNYSIGGTASNGVDHVSFPGSITIPAGSDAATLFVTPIEDVLPEADESVVVTLVTNAAYSIGSPGSATVLIADNDRTPQGPKFRNLSQTVTGGFQFDISADRGRIYILDTSTNLVEWKPFVTNVTPSDIFGFIDAAATNDGNRYYRVRLP